MVFGCAGNSAAVFPMRRLGMEVWPINTVQFSNHTQYEAGWQEWRCRRATLPPCARALQYRGAGALRCGAERLSGLGGAGGRILAVVAAVKRANPAALYFCAIP